MTKNNNILTVFMSWQKDFYNFVNDFDSYDGNIFKELKTINHDIIFDAGHASSTKTDSRSELFNAIMMACFLASRYQKNVDKYNEIYQKNIDCLKEVNNQKKAITKILKFLKSKAPLLNSLNSSLLLENQNRGIIAVNNEEAWGKHFYILNSSLFGYQSALDGLQMDGRYSVGCLEYPTKYKPKRSPEVAAMLIIQLAVYFDGLTQNTTPWLMINNGFSVAIPVNLNKLAPEYIQIIADLVEHSLKVIKLSNHIKDDLRKRIRPGIKLCPWPESGSIQ